MKNYLKKLVAMLLAFAILATAMPLTVVADGLDDTNFTIATATDLTDEPTAEPAGEPTTEPSTESTVEPNMEPTAEPTSTPMVEPAATPTVEPTAIPTAESTAMQTATPTAEATFDPNVGISLLSLDIDNIEVDNSTMNIHVDDIVVGQSFSITWDEVSVADHYEISIVRIETSDNETPVTNRTSVSGLSYPVSSSDVPADSKAFRIFVAAAADATEGSNDNLICQATVTVGIRYEEKKDMEVKIVIDGDASVEWARVSDADYYQYTVKNESDGTYIYQNNQTTSRSFFIEEKDIVANEKYTIWVGAYSNNSSEALCQHKVTMKLKIGCPHLKSRIEPYSLENGFEYYDAEQHYVIDIYKEYCQYCDKLLDDRYEQKTLKDHSNSPSGVCVYCKYAGSECTHTSYHNGNSVITYEINDDGETHNKLTTYNRVCDFCNAIIPFWVDEDIREDYVDREDNIKHTFVNGLCECGYAQAEELTVAMQRSATSALVGETIGATASIAGGNGDYTVYWNAYCDGECLYEDITGGGSDNRGAVIADRAGEWVFEVIVIDSNGERVTAQTEVITVEEAACDHTYSWVERKDLEECESVSDIQHRIRTYYENTCSKCNTVNGSTFEDTFEDHIFDENGKCICGAVKETDLDCVHEWESTVSETKLEQMTGNDLMTKHKVTTIYTDVCKKCGTLSSHETTEYVAHVFDKNGKCECGYIEVTEECDHATTGVPEGEPVYQSVDNNVHSITTYERHKCECGQINELRATTVQTAHVFVNGICVCGYTKLADLSITLSHSFDANGNLNLSWNSVDTADHYGINYCINDVAAFDAVQNVGNVTSYQIPASQLSNGAAVKFWVGAYLADGSMVPVSNDTTDKVQAETYLTVPTRAESVSGSFGSATYTMTAGEPLTVTVNAQCTGGELAKVTINGVTASMVSQPSADLAGGTEWSGTMTIDGTKAPFNVPGTYEVQLWVKTKSGYADSVAKVTIVVEEAPIAETVSGAFDCDEYSMEAGEQLNMTVTATATGGELARVTINGSSDSMEAPVSVDIAGGTEWSSIMTIDGTKAPFNVPGTYEVQLWVKTQSGYADSVAKTTIVVEETVLSETVSGKFDCDLYSIELGDKLNMTVTASSIGGELARVTINGSSASMEAPVSVDIAGGTKWSGTMTIDGTKAPFNVPGTYEVQLWVKTKSGYAESVAKATIVVEEPAESLTATMISVTPDKTVGNLGEVFTFTIKANAVTDRVTVHLTDGTQVGECALTSGTGICQVTAQAIGEQKYSFVPWHDVYAGIAMDANVKVAVPSLTITSPVDKQRVTNGEKLWPQGSATGGIAEVEYLLTDASGIPAQVTVNDEAVSQWRTSVVNGAYMSALTIPAKLADGIYQLTVFGYLTAGDTDRSHAVAYVTCSIEKTAGVLAELYRGDGTDNIHGKFLYIKEGSYTFRARGNATAGQVNAFVDNVNVDIQEKTDLGNGLREYATTISLTEGVHTVRFVSVASDSEVKVNYAVYSSASGVKYASSDGVMLKRWPSESSGNRGEAFQKGDEVSICGVCGDYYYAKNDGGYGFIANSDLLDKKPINTYRIQQPSDGTYINLWDNQPIQLKWDTYPGADYYIVEVLLVEEHFSHTFSYKHDNVAGKEVQEMSITALQEDAKKRGANFLVGGTISITITAYKK